MSDRLRAEERNPVSPRNQIAFQPFCSQTKQEVKQQPTQSSMAKKVKQLQRRVFPSKKGLEIPEIKFSRHLERVKRAGGSFVERMAVGDASVASIFYAI